MHASFALDHDTQTFSVFWDEFNNYRGFQSFSYKIGFTLVKHIESTHSNTLCCMIILHIRKYLTRKRKMRQNCVFASDRYVCFMNSRLAIVRQIEFSKLY